MNIVFIVIMVAGLLVFAASYLLPKDEGEEIGLKKSEEAVSFKKPSVAVPPTEGKAPEAAGENIKAIEAAKQRAREAIDTDYKFDLHLTDSSDRTVAELEHDLLAGLDLSEGEADAGKNANASKSGNANKGGSGKGNGKKKSQQNKNDRYDDLQFTDAEPAAAAKEEPKTEQKPKTAPKTEQKNEQKPAQNKSQGSKNGGKKGKKK